MAVLRMLRLTIDFISSILGVILSAYSDRLNLSTSVALICAVFIFIKGSDNVWICCR